MATITYAGVRKRGHDARWLPSRSTVISAQFYCDASQFDFMSQITGEAAWRLASDGYQGEVGSKPPASLAQKSLPNDVTDQVPRGKDAAVPRLSCVRFT